MQLILEQNNWRKLLYYPLMWLLSLTVAIKRGIFYICGKPVKISSWICDGLGPGCREVKENIKNAHALSLLYNYPFRPAKTVSEIIDNFWFATPNAQAVRNRKKIVTQMIAEAIRTAANVKQREVHIMSLACGSAEAVLEAMSTVEKEGIVVKCLLVDVSRTALRDAMHKAIAVGLGDKVKIKIANLADPESISRVANGFSPDIIEVVGLLDYLTDEQATLLFEACRQVLPLWGELFTCNIMPNGERIFLEQVLGWYMIYRTTEELHRLLVNSGYDDKDVNIQEEPLHIHAIARCHGGTAFPETIVTESNKRSEAFVGPPGMLE